jgi:hypothetical protein
MSRNIRAHAIPAFREASAVNKLPMRDVFRESVHSAIRNIKKAAV